jgi:LmbE family N-acetylglucosaminyl deacetylase
MRARSRKKLLVPPLLVLWLGGAGLGWPPNLNLRAQTPASLQAATDRMIYSVGEQVWLRIIPPSPQAMRTLDSYRFSVRYAGESLPLVDRVMLDDKQPQGPPGSYFALWKVPRDARSGRYEVDLRVQDPVSHQVIQEIPHLCSFVVIRQVAQILGAEVGQSYYTSGDAIACSMMIQNRSGQPLQGLRLEFSERYWPWIVQQTQKVGTNITTLNGDIELESNERLVVRSPRCAEAPAVKEPGIRQYSAVLWDAARKNVYAIAITPMIWVNPPGVTSPQAYPGQFTYPGLDKVNTKAYRDFRPESYGADVIKFDTHQTMFPSGAVIPLRFSLVNPTGSLWHRVSVLTRLLSPDGTMSWGETGGYDLLPGDKPRLEESWNGVSRGVSGIFRAEVELKNSAGLLLAKNDLEFGVNPLPKSVLLFCAHEDDDGGQHGFIRALVENNIPLHVVYFTSGDAGACDRYYEHSCGPTEALNFGSLRMDEARAALGHLGVPHENITFLGLPDGGSGKIWYDHPQASDPYLSIQLAGDHAPYEGLYQPNLPFARDSVVAAAAEIIKKLQPEVIFTAHPPAEGHIDHIVCNYFAVKAMQQLLREGAISPSTELRVNRIIDPKNHPATPYHYEDHNFFVSGEAAALAQEAGWYYQSQGGNKGQGNIRTWNQLRRSEGYRKVLDWKEHEGWNEKE